MLTNFWWQESDAKGGCRGDDLGRAGKTDGAGFVLAAEVANPLEAFESAGQLAARRNVWPCICATRPGFTQDSVQPSHQWGPRPALGPLRSCNNCVGSLSKELSKDCQFVGV